LQQVRQSAIGDIDMQVFLLVPGQDRRDEVEDRGRFPGLEIHRLTRPDPGQVLPGVETACHPGHGGPRVPGRGHGHRRGRAPAPVLPEQPDQLPPADCGTIALTVPEAQRLFHLLTTLTCNLRPRAARALITRHLNWSEWRRHHQARARWHHYRTRLALTA
jgi:hypothetical protein